MKKNKIILSKKAERKINSSKVLSAEEKKSFLKHINYLSIEEREELYSII